MAGYPAMPAAGASLPGYPGLPAVSSAPAGFPGAGGSYPSMPAASAGGSYPSMPAASAGGSYPSMPAASAGAGFPLQQQPASYPAGQGFSMAYPPAQQQFPQQPAAGFQQPASYQVS